MNRVIDGRCMIFNLNRSFSHYYDA